MQYVTYCVPQTLFHKKELRRSGVLKFQLFAGVSDVSLCGGKTRDRYAIRRAGNIIQADFVAEFNRRRVSAVFAADTDVKLLICAFAEFNGGIHKLADADGIKT